MKKFFSFLVFTIKNPSTKDDSLSIRYLWNQVYFQDSFESIYLQSQYYLYSIQKGESNQAELAWLKFFTEFIFYFDPNKDAELY